MYCTVLISNTSSYRLCYKKNSSFELHSIQPIDTRNLEDCLQGGKFDSFNHVCILSYGNHNYFNYELFRITVKLLGLLVCLSVAYTAPGNEAYDNNEFADMQFQNNYDGVLHVNCNPRDGMYRVASVHSNHHEDRIWSWECRRVIRSHDTPRCGQTGYVNQYDDPMFFTCGANQYIAGVYSEHDNYREDRRWKFTCCSAPNHYTRSCRLTGFVNDYDSPIHFIAGPDEVMTGVFSIHDNHRE